MSEHTPTPWFHRQAGTFSPQSGTAYDWIADSPEHGKHRKIIVCRDACDPADYAFIVKAVNSHDVLVKALQEIVQYSNSRFEHDVAHAALASIKETV